jgi:hypothetical protein
VGHALGGAIPETARRILHIIRTANIGGAELVLLRLLERNNPRRYKPSVLSLRPPKSLEQEYAALAPPHSLNMRASVPTPGAIQRLRTILNREQPDLIQAWMYHGSLAATVGAMLTGFKGPLLWNIRHFLHDMRYERRASRAVIRLNAALSRLPRAIIYNARSGIEQHQSIGFAPEAARSASPERGLDTA